jgi:NitT/TauT family transport system ATP-binding protein
MPLKAPPRESRTTSSRPASVAVGLSAVSKTFRARTGPVQALHDVTFAVQPGETLGIVGTSGCGKSTLLEVICGLEDPSAGIVAVEGDSAGRLQRCALMPQRDLLLPWRSALDNAALAPQLQGATRAQARTRALGLFARFGLEEFARASPAELSGGMRQRVALARAFAQDADILLMDEPFGALDAMTRDILHSELEGLWSDKNLTVVFVTHNVREAVRLADRVVLLTSRPGRIAATIDIDIDRPRRIDSPEVSEVSADITDQLRAEVRRHADD